MTAKERIEKVFRDYLEVIMPLIEQYQIYESKFPVSILNEIRALLTHLAKAELMTGEEQMREAGKAEGHITRLLRDCYKYNCVALENKYREAMSVLSKTAADLSNFVKTHDDALDALFLAKCLEGSLDSYRKENEIYENYKKAFNLYKELKEQMYALI